MKLLALSRVMEFFRERFSLRENVLWRVMSLLKPYKHWVILANLCLFLAQMLSAGGLVALQPLFSRTLSQVSVVNGQPAPGTAGKHEKKSQLAEQLKKFKNKPGFWSKVLNSTTPTSGTLQNPGLLARTRDGAVKRWGQFSSWANASTPRFIALYACFLIGLLSINGVFQFFGDFLMAKVSTQVTSDLMRNIYANVLRQELNFFNSQSTGQLLNTCFREVFDLQTMLQFLASTRIMLPIRMATLFCALLVINLRLSCLLVVMLPLIILPTFMLTRKIKKSLSRELDEETGAMDVMAQGFHGVQAIKAFGAEKLEVQYLDPPIAAYIRCSRARRGAQAIIGPVVDALDMAVLLIVYVVALYIISVSKGAHHFEPSRLILFMIAITQFYKPMRDIMTMNVRMQRARAVARRIFALLDRQPQIADTAEAVDFPRDWREMVFDHVYLTYKVVRKGQEKKRRALVDVKLRIRRGEAIALIGPNGAGKSSMVNLICRLYEPTGGEIRLGPVPLSQIKLAQIREQICLISQQPVLFNRSVAENIAFGLEGISQEEIVEAAKASGAHGFVMQLPQGYDTYVGEQGRLLSGGERQKIVLARAFVRHPQILILDEPTTGLDRQTTEEFLDLVGSLHRKGMTILYITHEFSQLARFERVFQITPDKHIVEIEHPAPAEAPASAARGGAQ